MNVAALTLFVTDPRASRRFYEQVFEAEPIFADEVSCAFRLGGLIVNLLAEPAAVELVAPAEIGEAGSPPRFQLTIEVADVDVAAARLAGLGVEFLNGPLDRPWGLRTAAFADPDGHVWELAADLP